MPILLFYNGNFCKMKKDWGIRGAFVRKGAFPMGALEKLLANERFIHRIVCYHVYYSKISRIKLLL